MTSSVRRCVLLTGGARGIGRGIVDALAERDVDLVFTYRASADQAKRLADALVGQGRTVVAEFFDLAAGDGDRLVRQCVDRFGRLDSVILNAGTWAGGRVDRLPPDEWWRVVETNLRGNYSIVRAALPHLRRSAAGSVLYVSSVVGLVGFPGDTAYASAKSAMVGQARALAKELGPAGIRVNVLAPGFVETDMTSQISGAAREKILDRTVVGRFGTAEEIARAAVFLAEEATFCTGSVLTVDGGWSL